MAVRCLSSSCAFSLPASPQPCYCSICTKTAGAGGFAINLGADWKSMRVEGSENLSIYRAVLARGEDGAATEVSFMCFGFYGGKKLSGFIQVSLAQRHFCRLCGSHLWLYDERWPEQVHPHASAIDTELPKAPEKTHIMLAYKAPWVVPEIGPNDKQFLEYPRESLAEWHEKRSLQK